MLRHATVLHLCHTHNTGPHASRTTASLGARVKLPRAHRSVSGHGHGAASGLDSGAEDGSGRDGAADAEHDFWVCFRHAAFLVSSWFVLCWALLRFPAGRARRKLSNGNLAWNM